MSAKEPKASQGRRRRGKKPKAVDLWRPVASLEPPEAIQRANDATAVIRSLGAPPLKGQGSLAEQHLALAVERAADMAMALALTAGLLPADDPADAEDD
ncbi:hypothetical protein [Iamia sp.]|jgi:hypothetical protein|uniref:hypothetical protein n=1 Tax=Iamia sp. TaxID=2722710 RepID=UPI002CDC506E|nr:hypothetical protein [Iamia sp.]HXH56972.1 hypothetical protein [Iamia sp.]